MGNTDTKQLACRYGRMTILANDTGVGRWLEEYGEFAQAEIDFLEPLIPPGAVVLDIGAFIGTHTLAFAHRVGGDGKVYAFEPRPEFFSLLRENIASNGIKNVVLHDAALSDEPGYIHLVPLVLTEPCNFGGTSLPSTGEIGSETTEAIPIITIDQLDLPQCALIKIDAEGMEPRILRGGKDTLSKLRPIVYAEVLCVHDGWEIVLFMRSLGYHAFLHMTRMFSETNFRGNPNDISSGARHPMLILLPEEKLEVSRLSFSKVEGLLPVLTADDLVLGLLKCPTYKNVSLANTQAAKVFGVDFFAIECELKPLQATLSSVQQEIAGIYASWSWRLTAPLRNGMHFLKGASRLISRKRRTSGHP